MNVATAPKKIPVTKLPPLIAKLSWSQRAELKKQIDLELARRYAKAGDILNWGKVLFPEKFPLGFCEELHKYFVEIRGDEMTNTEAPRNHAKTTIKCFLIPIFQALEEPETFRHYLNVQATHTKSAAVNLSIRTELERNTLLHELYGEQVTKEKWTDAQFVLKCGVVFSAIGAGESIRGLNYNNLRPDYMLIDDLYDEEDINNPESTLKKNNWFWSSLYPARAKSSRFSIHVQGTAINNEDLLEELKKKDRWKSRTFRAIKDWDTKKVLWPELNTYDSLMADLKDMPSVIFHREMQNERRDEASAIVKRSWLEGWEYDSIPDDRTIVSVELGVDPSIGAKVMSDFTGVSLIAKTRYQDSMSGYEYWIEGLWEEHASLDERVRLLESIKNGLTQSINRANIEGIAGFKDFVAEVRRRTNLPVREISNVKDKISTLESKSHHFENKRVHISRKIPQKLRDTLLYQLTTNVPKHDDVRDAVLLCLESPQAGMGWRPVI